MEPKDYYMWDACRRLAGTAGQIIQQGEAMLRQMGNDKIVDANKLAHRSRMQADMDAQRAILDKVEPLIADIEERYFGISNNKE